MHVADQPDPADEFDGWEEREALELRMLAIEREVDEYGGISQAMQHARQRAWERERAKIRRDLWRLMDRPRRAGRFIPVQRSAPKPFMLADGSHAYVAASHGQSVTLPYVSMLGRKA